MLFLLSTITLLVIAIDQLTKYLAFRSDASFVVISRVVEIVHNRNAGVAFGLGGQVKYAAVVWSVVSLLTVILLVFFYLRFTQRRAIDTVSLGLIIGGALGNLVDRVFNAGAVRDFIQLLFIRWPAFNVADVAIVGGVILIVFSVAFDHADPARPNADTPA